MKHILGSNAYIMRTAVYIVCVYCMCIGVEGCNSEYSKFTCNILFLKEFFEGQREFFFFVIT